MRVPSQFDVQAMIRASEAEGLGSEVWRTLVEVWGGVEGRMELPERAEFGHVGGNRHEFNPPSSVCPLEVVLETSHVGGQDGVLSDVKLLDNAPGVGPPGELSPRSHGPLREDRFLDKWIGAVKQVGQVFGQADGGRDVGRVFAHFSSDPQYRSRGVEGVMGVGHVFPCLFRGQLGVGSSECFGQTYLGYLPRVDVGQPLFHAIEEDGLYQLVEQFVDGCSGHGMVQHGGQGESRSGCLLEHK